MVHHNIKKKPSTLRSILDPLKCYPTNQRFSSFSQLAPPFKSFMNFKLTLHPNKFK
jgi:hypothetical protein